MDSTSAADYSIPADPRPKTRTASIGPRTTISGLNLFPNPTSGLFDVSLEVLAAEEIQISIIDKLGRAFQQHTAHLESRLTHANPRHRRKSQRIVLGHCVIEGSGVAKGIDQD